MKINECLELQEVRVPVNGGHVVCKVSPELMTLDMVDRFQTQDTENPDLGFVAESLCAVVSEWDLLENDGEPVVITVERIRGLPIGILTPIMNGVFEAVNPTNEEATT